MGMLDASTGGGVFAGVAGGGMVESQLSLINIMTDHNSSKHNNKMNYMNNNNNPSFPSPILTNRGQVLRQQQQ